MMLPSQNSPASFDSTSPIHPETPVILPPGLSDRSIPGGLVVAFLFLGWILAGPHVGMAQSSSVVDSVGEGTLMFDDFEGYGAGELPDRWSWITSKSRGPLTADLMTERRSFLVREEDGNHYVRATVTNFWHRIAYINEQPTEWMLDSYPCLGWDWRAVHLPEGAREDKVNDTGAAVYVYFGKDWLGRPRSIKYSYSSTLPVGTELSFGPLKLVVVSSGIDGSGEWVTIQRNVAEDYRHLFGRRPPKSATLITLWSDTDTTKDTAVADFDNIGARVCQ